MLARALLSSSLAKTQESRERAATIDLRLAHGLLAKFTRSRRQPRPNPQHREAGAFSGCAKLMPPLTLSSSLAADGTRMGRGASMVTQKVSTESTVETLIVLKLGPIRKNSFKTIHHEDKFSSSCYPKKLSIVDRIYFEFAKTQL
jgi:hypothetical protein